GDADAVDPCETQIDRADLHREAHRLLGEVVGQLQAAEADAIEEVPRRFQSELRTGNPGHHPFDHVADGYVLTESQLTDPVVILFRVLFDLGFEELPGEAEALYARLVIEPDEDRNTFPRPDRLQPAEWTRLYHRRARLPQGHQRAAGLTVITRS